MLMDKKKRPVPYPIGSDLLKTRIKYLMEVEGISFRTALGKVQAVNARAQLKPMKGERCEAKTRKGTPCQCKALQNGRCKFHGGLSTGPRTPEGKAKVAANLKRVRDDS